jgi:hypothetical protein
VIDDDPLALNGIGPRSEGVTDLITPGAIIGLVVPSDLDLVKSGTDDTCGSNGTDELVLNGGAGNDWVLLGDEGSAPETTPDPWGWWFCS